MATVSVNRSAPLDVEIRARTLAVFSYVAQRRVPGGDYVDFATGKDSDQVSESVYRLRVDAPIAAFTDLRIYFLVSAKPDRPYDVRVQLSQGGGPVGDPLHCSGTVGADGKMVFDSVEATFP